VTGLGHIKPSSSTFIVPFSDKQQLPKTSADPPFSQYYVVNRTDNGPGQTHFPRTLADQRLKNAPDPTSKTKIGGRRPHKHLDMDENGPYYRKERINLAIDQHPDAKLIKGESSNTALLPPLSLPNLFAYPSNPFDYAKQNCKGRTPGYTPGHGRIITDGTRGPDL
jgi:hypothetical protein